MNPEREQPPSSGPPPVVQIPQPPPGQPLQFGPQGSPYPVQPIVRSGKLLILDRLGFPIPTDTCFKCNGPATVTKSKNLAWCPPAYHVILLGIFVLSLLAIIVWAIVLMCVQKRARIELGLCGECQNRRALKTTLWLTGAGICLAATVYGAVELNWPLFFGGLFALFVCLFGMAFALRLAVARRIDDRWIHLGGAGAAYLNKFPNISVPPR